MNLAEVYQRANGRPATNEDLARIVKVANALDVAGQDTFLCLLVAFDHYHNLYKEIPGEIAERVEEIAESAQELAKTDIERLQATAQSEVAKAVQRAAEKSAAAAGVRAVVIWIVGAIIVSTLAVIGISSWIGTKAYQAGYEAGTVELAKRDGFAATEEFRKAMDLQEKGRLHALLEFGATADARKTLDLQRKGELHKILACKGKGWAVENGVCYPKGYTEGQNSYLEGWAVTP